MPCWKLSIVIFLVRPVRWNWSILLSCTSTAWIRSIIAIVTVKNAISAGSSPVTSSIVFAWAPRSQVSCGLGSSSQPGGCPLCSQGTETNGFRSTYVLSWIGAAFYVRYLPNITRIPTIEIIVHTKQWSYSQNNWYERWYQYKWQSSLAFVFVIPPTSYYHAICNC